MNPDSHRQQVLFLWMADSGLHARVVGWAFHDGNDPVADLSECPYERAVDALADGWRLIQISPVPTPSPGYETVGGALRHEAVFERIVERTG